MTRKLKEKILDYYKSYYKNTLGIPNWKELSNNQLKEEELENNNLKYLATIFGSLKNQRLLDIGCGTGGFVIASAKYCKESVGVDPDLNALNICAQKKKEFKINNCKFINSFGEKLPFEDYEFNIVYALTVLEHVQNLDKTISEMVRVTRSGGFIYIKSPNYLSFYEGHYKLFWLPLFPKKLAKIYLRLRRRPTDFIDSINYLTPGRIQKITKMHNIKTKIIKHKVERHRGMINLLIYIYQKIFKVEQNIEIIIQK